MTEQQTDVAKNTEQENQIEESKLTIEDKVIAKISKLALQNVDGILDMKGSWLDSVSNTFKSDYEPSTAGISVESGEKQAKVEISIILEYGKNAQKVFEAIKKVVKENVKQMTGMDVVTINVHVVDVMTSQEFANKKKEKAKNDKKSEEEE